MRKNFLSFFLITFVLLTLLPTQSAQATNFTYVCDADYSNIRSHVYIDKDSIENRGEYIAAWIKNVFSSTPYLNGKKVSVAMFLWAFNPNARQM
jgi:hypothetical protein